MKKTITNTIIHAIAAIAIMICAFIFCCINGHAAGIGEHEHAMTEWVITCEPTCTEYGWEYRECAEGCEYFEMRTIAAYGHDNRQIEVIEPSCTKAGYTKCVCNTCGQENGQYPKPPQGHELTEWTTTVEATCSENGCEQRHCAECDYIESRIVEATGHEFIAISKTEPTCQEEGYMVYCCVSCEIVGFGESIPTTDHNWTEWETVTPPACISSGCKERHCKDCKVLDAREIEPSHELIATVTEPTCEVGGYTTYACQNCDVVYTRVATKPLGHELVPSVTKPTCEQDGYTTYSCRNCDTVYIRDKVPAIGHEYGLWQNFKDAYGVATRTCKHCGDVETKTLLPIKKPVIRKDSVFTFAVINRNEHLRISKLSLRPVACHF